jgi:hypothetical protein
MSCSSLAANTSDLHPPLVHPVNLSLLQPCRISAFKLIPSVLKYITHNIVSKISNGTGEVMAKLMTVNNTYK